ALVERVLYLEGVPNLQRLSALRIGETVPEQFANDLAVEMAALQRLNAGIALCVAPGGQGTRERLAGTLPDEEGHGDWLETQLESINQIGLDNYLAQQLHRD